MSTGKSIVAIVIFGFSGFLMVLGIRHYMEKGFLMNNAYLYASKEQREKMNKKPYYRQSAIIFGILSVVFIVIGLSLVLQDDRILLFEILLISGAIVYAVVSSVQIGKQETK
ncbi:MAG: DUF3784 domain-containing protein [Blautia sp.]|nr:DUF3784 domain-containing protein [Blautia sp.]